MRQLEPGAREGLGEVLRVLTEPLRDLAVRGVHLHRHVGIGHDRIATDRRIFDIDRLVLLLDVDRLPLPGTGRTLLQLPLIIEQQMEVAVVPACRMRGPGTLDAAGHGVATDAARGLVEPAQALILDPGALGLRSQQLGVTVAMRLADRMTAGGQGDGLLVVHRHAREGHAHIMGGLERIGPAVDTLGVDVDQTHHHRRQRVVEVALTGVAAVGVVAGSEPFLLRAPVDVLLRMPDVLAAEGKPKGLEPHGLIGHGAGQHDEVGPTERVAVFALDRPQQTARLVQVDVVGPTVDRSEALIAGARAAAPIGDAIGAGGVPGHADHETAVMSPVGRPPVLAVGHQGVQVFLDGFEIERLDRFAIVEVRVQRIGLGVVLMQDVEIERFRPPVHDRGSGRRLTTVHHRAPACCRRIRVHRSLHSWLR